jgi:hypothetical protein
MALPVNPGSCLSKAQEFLTTIFRKKDGRTAIPMDSKAFLRTNVVSHFTDRRWAKLAKVKIQEDTAKTKTALYTVNATFSVKI